MSIPDRLEHLMNPTTELDESFSQPGATPTAWDTVRRALEPGEVSWIATVGRDGRARVTPRVVVFHDDAAYFCTGAGEQKAVNLRTNANLVLTPGCNNGQEGFDV